MKTIIEGDKIYLVDGENKYKAAIFTDHYYSLRIINGVPILEIDGVRMHLIKDFETPLEYSEEVVKKLGVKNDDLVLDCCGGLGNTAIEASKKGKNVISCEIREEILELAKVNPFSNEYFSKKIEIRNKDVFEEIKKFKENTFDKIIHDPPRFSKAPELYSSDFYRELYRVLKKNGKLFHYVDTIGKYRGRKIELEVERRLIKTGFNKIKYEKKLQGLLAIRGIPEL